MSSNDQILDHDSDSPEEPLSGGNMNIVYKVGDTVRRAPTPASDTLQRLLAHLHTSGVHWVPRPLGRDERGRDVFSYIEGAVEMDFPSWILRTEVLVDIAHKLRQFHDATTTFHYELAQWNFPAREPEEVIIHHDFAPYNCVFRNEQFCGLIDFDLCAPGPRLWDIAYTAYRFVPLMPLDLPGTTGPLRERLALFVEAYKQGGGVDDFSCDDVLETTQLRLKVLAEWSLHYAEESHNPQLAIDAGVYVKHADLLKTV